MQRIVPLLVFGLSSSIYRPLFLLLTILVWCTPSGRSQPTDWKMQIDKGGIQIHSRWKESTGDQKVREIRATFTAAATPESMIKTLKDADSAHTWMVGAKTSSLLAGERSGSWYAYTEFDLPWPLQNQDLVALYRLETQENGFTSITIEARPSYKPEYPKIERMQHFEARWTLEALSNGRTKVSYWAFTYRKPSAPRWISDPVVQNTLWKTMAGFRELVER